jgi:hypothetical protein
MLARTSTKVSNSSDAGGGCVDESDPSSLGASPRGVAMGSTRALNTAQ